MPGHRSTSISSGVPHRGAFVRSFVRPGESVFALFVFEVLAAVVTKFYSNSLILLSEIYIGWRFVDDFFTTQQQQKSFRVRAYRMGVFGGYLDIAI